MKTAEWTLEYDMHTDETYSCPACPDCGTPIFSVEDDGNGYCDICEEKVALNERQKEWIEKSYGMEDRTEPCFICGSPSSVTYRKNPVTGEWVVAFGNCPHCGTRFIV